MRKTLNAIMLGPLLVTQGLYTASRAMRLPEPDGPRKGQAGAGMPLRLLVVGDSSAAGVGVQTQNEALSGRLVEALSDRFAVDWTLRAQSGATSSTTLSALRKLAPTSCDVAVIALGVNDAKNGMRTRVWRRNYAELIGLVRRAGAAQVYASGLPPVHAFPLLPQPLRRVLGARAQHFDDILRDVAAETGATHVPFDLPFDPRLMASDGFHPGPQVYTKWAARIRDRVVRDIG